jgi:toxin-antitoxin system PIN domain toxin
MRALLDVSVLIALFDSEHVHHNLVSSWLVAEAAQGWATCPLTQNGCIRILSQPKYINRTAASLVADVLAEATASPGHAFWTDSYSVVESGAVDWDRLLTARHLTDVYLLGLACRNGGRLATLDQGIPLAAVPNARAENLTVLVPKSH